MSNYDIAIIGMGCVFPEANNTEEYWKNILSGEEFVRDMPEHLWPMKQFWSEVKKDHKSVTIKGSFLKDFDFNPIEYGIPPKNLEGVDRAQLVAMEATRQALADAGIEPRSKKLEEAVTVIGASGVDEFAHVALYLNRLKFFREFGPGMDEAGIPKHEQETLFEEFSQALKDRGHEFVPSVTAVGAIVSSLSNRVAQAFGVKGFNMTTDGACGSSFVALTVACHALMAGDARIAIAGGVDLGINPAIYIGFSRLGGLSPNGRSNPFDNSANGLVIGEGGGMVVLKRLEDAMADGDEIKAVIRGVGSTSDGAGQAIYNPSADQRTIALKKALKSAGIKSSQVQFLEAHATSTVVGDANEYDAIEGAYGDRDASDPLYLGTVKHQIGHLKAGAGMAGLIKTVLAMNAGKIPHMPRFRELTKQANRKTDSLVVNTEVLDWNARKDGSRYGAVTTSGFGGVNYHVILEQAADYQAPPERSVPSRDMAIVGIVNKLPGSTDPETFWNKTLAGTNNFVEVNPEALGWTDNVASGPEKERIGTKKIGLIDDFDINYLRLKISPNSVSQTSPAQILSATLADQLLTQCGYELKQAKNIGVSIGSMHDDNYATISYPLTADEYAEAIRQTGTYSRHASRLDGPLQKTVTAVVEAGPPHTEATLPGWMSNINAGVVANRLNCQGPNFTVDTACSSGLASLLPAMYQLMFTDLDAMVTGGLNRHTTNVFATAVDRLGAIAETIPRPYDTEGAGFIAAEGGVMFLLKRLEDARKAGDTVHAVIRNIAGSSEYKSKSMVAPTEDALIFAIEEGMRNVSLKPEEIGVVDTHGSANRLSDIAEAGAIAKVLRPKEGSTPPVRITAVKSHVGHSYGGSGSAGILSVIGALNNRVVPGIRNLENVRPEIEPMLHRASPQKGSEILEKEFLHGGITSLGLGGANYFAVVSAGDEGLKNAEEGRSVEIPEPAVDPPSTTTVNSTPSVSASAVPDQGPAGTAEGVYTFRGRSRTELREAIASQIDSGRYVNDGSADLALTVSADSETSLKTKLTTVLKFMDGSLDLKPLENQGIYLSDFSRTSTEKFVFCFPGQGTHYVGMGRSLYETRPEFREVIDTVHRLASADLGFDLLADLYGEMDPKKAAELLGGIDGAQISLFAVEVGLARVYTSMGVVPDMMVGHSFGEISALAAQGVWSLEDGYRVVAARIRAAKDGGRGLKLKMMSIICDDTQRDALLSLAGDDVVLSNINAPGQFIFAGLEVAILKIADTAKTLGLETRVLAIGSAFHSRFMEDAVGPFRTALEALPCRQPTIPIMSTITGDYISFTDSADLARHLSLQLTTRLDMPTVINRLYADGARNFLEVGPKWAVTKLIDAILKGREYTAVPSLHPKIGDEETFRRALAYVTGLRRIGSHAPAAGGKGPFNLDAGFMDYLQQYEPAVVALINEAHRRFVSSPSSTVPDIGNIPSPTGPKPAVPQPTATFPATAASATLAAPAAAAGSAAASSSDGADLTTWVARSRSALAEATGYPENMLGEELDLEADLGIDSVQRAEIWGRLVNEFGLDPEARPESIKSINELAAELQRLSGDSGSIAPATAPPAGAAAPAGAVGTDLATWVARSRSALAEATGYPEDMLGEELDLEADLGIDSVQRAEIWGRLVNEFGLDPEARPESIKSINELAAELQRLSGDSGSIAPAAAPPAGAAAPAGAVGTDLATWVARSRSALAEATGYPEDMLGEELDLEADLGIDSVQRAEIWGRLVNEFGLDPEARPESIKSINELAAELQRLSGDSGSIAPAAAPPAGAAAPAGAVGTDLATWVARSRSALAEATGYPEDMLGEELDLEADLGIDSVQRAEIWGRLVNEFGLDPEARPESIKSINELAAELQRLSGDSRGVSGDASVSAAAALMAPEPGLDVNRLFYSGWLPVSENEAESFDCRSVLVITADARASKTWAARLEGTIEKTVVLTSAELKKTDESDLADLVVDADTILYLAHARAASSKASGSKLSDVILKETRSVYDTFRKLAPALRRSPVRLICPVRQDGSFGADESGTVYQGAFPAGFIRSLSYEIPEARFQLIDTGTLDWSEAADRLLSTAFPFLEAGLLDGEWVKPSLRKVSEGGGKQVHLAADDLVLVTGGARGIVFECVHALAKETGCRLLLTGRTEPAAGDEPWLLVADKEIDAAMRSLEMSLVKGEGMNLGKARTEAARCRSQWEVARSLRRLATDGIKAEYRRCDVSSRESLEELISSISTPIRGVVHGAGVQKSRLLEDLADDAVALTMGTKVVPLFLLQELLDISELKFFSAFGSIAGLFGNAGQSDYALANDMLASAVSVLGSRNGFFAQTVEWTAWTGTGMVTEAESKRFRESGLNPVTVEDGVRLYMQAVGSTKLPRVAAFNEGAAFTAARSISPWSAAAAPRTALKDDDGSIVRFETSRDVYIEQHLVRRNPVVPGTFTTEVLSECLNDRKKVLKDIGFRRPVWVRDGSLDVEVVDSDGRLLLLPADRPVLEGPALANLSFASASTGTPKKVAKSKLPDFAPAILDELKKAAGEKQAPFYSRLDANFAESLITGPVFRGVRSTLEADGMFYSLLRLTDDAARMFAIPGDFVINPVVSDMAIQAGAAWAMMRHDVMAIPYSIGELRVYKPTESRDAVAVCREISINPEESRMDIVVRETDGSVVFAMDEVVLKTISDIEK